MVIIIPKVVRKKLEEQEGLKRAARRRIARQALLENLLHFDEEAQPVLLEVSDGLLELNAGKRPEIFIPDDVPTILRNELRELRDKTYGFVERLVEMGYTKKQALVLVATKYGKYGQNQYETVDKWGKRLKRHNHKAIPAILAELKALDSKDKLIEAITSAGEAFQNAEKQLAQLRNK